MKESKNIKLTIAYDGTDYAGWQRQKNEETIQGVIEDNLRKVSGEKDIKLYGAGRTDAGVHALGQVANFKTRSTIPVKKWLVILNNLLPRDIRIKAVEEVAQEFNSRYSAKSRIYRYYLINTLGKTETHSIQEVFLGRYCHYQDSLLDQERIKNTARYLLGFHDFSAFSCKNNPTKSRLPKDNIRDMKRINIIRENSLLIFSMEANAFLYKMARLIVGTLIDFSIGRREPKEILEVLENKDSQKSGTVVPPNGLYLVAVKY